MKKWIQRIGKYYSSIFIDCIGLMIFSGLLSVFFQEYGWLPDEGIYGISQLVYQIILPVCISYRGGQKIGGHIGGIVAVLAASGALYRTNTVGVLAGMLSAPLGGFTWKYCEKQIQRRGFSSMQMLIKNLLVGLLGCLFSVIGYYVAAPALLIFGNGIGKFLKLLSDHQLSGLFCIFIEPLKVLFLNNVVNHGIFVPLGVQQVQESGRSVLFLIETNPGPGFGMLAAFYCMYREKRGEYGAMLFAVAAGGIHEVYFPVVLAHIRMLVPLIAGSAAGGLWFNFMDAGLGAPVSPGSVISILFMADKGRVLKVALGICLSALVSWAGTLVILAAEERKIMDGIAFISGKRAPDAIERVSGERGADNIDPVSTKNAAALQQEVSAGDPGKKRPIHQVGFVCDAGIGSSAMGAALFRRKLAEMGITDVQVQAYASDMVPDDMDLLVCQEDFAKTCPNMAAGIEIVTVNSLMDTVVLGELAGLIIVRNR